jgi:hypothetical protein
VRLFRFATLEGTETPADVPPNTRLDDAVVVKFVDVPAIAGPFNVSVYAATVKAPDERVSVPPTVTFPHIEAALFIVRLFNVTADRLAVPEPPITIFEFAPPTRVPQFIWPLSVNVLFPIDKPPPPGLKVPLIARELCKVTILEFVIDRPVNAVTVDGIRTPADVPPNTRLDDADVTKFVDVPAIVGPFNVSVLAPTVNVPAVRVNVPFTDKSAPNVMFLLILKLLSPPDIAFNVIFEPVPIVKFDVVPPVNDPPP